MKAKLSSGILHFTEQNDLARTKCLVDFQTRAASALRRYQAETERAVDKLHDLSTAEQQKESFERLAEHQRHSIEHAKWQEIDALLDSSRMVSDESEFNAQTAQLQQRIDDASEGRDQSRKILLKLPWSCRPLVYWPAFMVNCLIIVGLNVLLARFAGLTQAEMVIVIAADAAYVIRFVLLRPQPALEPEPEFQVDPIYVPDRAIS